MSVPVPVRWVPAATLSAIAEAIGRAMESWAQAWGLDTPRVLGCRAVPARAPADATEAGLPDLVDAVSHAMFGPGASRSALARPIVDQALVAWRDALGAVLGLAPGQPWPVPAASEPARAGDRGLQCRLQVGGQPLTLFIGMEPLCLSQWIRIPAPPALAHWKAEMVMADLPVTLQALLGTATVAVGDLAALEPGDVILLPRVAGPPVRLRGLRSAAALPAQLGHLNGHRAVQLAALSPGT